MKSRFIPLSLLFVLALALFGCGTETPASVEPAQSEDQAQPLATPTQTPTPTPILETSEGIGGQQLSGTVAPMPEEEYQGDTEGDQLPEPSDLTFVSTDLCNLVPKELVPCGRYDITFISESMICGGFPIPRRPESDRDVLVFQPGMDGEGEFVDTPVQTIASDGTLVLMSKQGEGEGTKSYKGSGVYPANGIEPERRIEWEFSYDTELATIEGSLRAIFELPDMGQCTVTKEFEGSPG